MFMRVPQPLHYAEALLEHYTDLARAADGGALLGGFVQAAARLADCELAQLYLLDAGHTSLGLSAECLESLLQPREAETLPADYKDEQLLQYSLCQNRVLSLSELNGSLHDTSFLPASHRPWRALLCLPLLDQRQAVQGLLLCASHAPRELIGFAKSLGLLGTFVHAQLQLLQRLRRPQQHSAPAPVTPCASGYGMIGESPAMRRTYQLIGKVLHSPYTVLVTGETGTGKELVARAIHDSGPRRGARFVVQNCSALPEHLLESELFGYRKGAFTGADRDRQGLFDAADGGTLFLDEIGDMPLSLQAKLLRVLQEGEVRPLGSNDTHRIDVRIVTATHRDLQAMVSAGEFREDLYYRLAQFPIELPPLRQRGEDILELARHFADKACAFLQRDPCNWSVAALDRLAGYAFPGNVRELKGMVERAVLLCETSELLPSHFNLRELPASTEATSNLRERLEQVERALLLDCLRRNGGNRTLAARELGLPRRTLLYRMERLNIHASEL
ncbi:sigma 54-interacting transcriptional regulator [Pseudomonas sp. ZM23]|uniref:Sigma 54-interacting transcriptional regulator n=1 Tax=Pseudomonas triclosanedens TaxID=2961893 RepID=A0ABY7A0G3_9PSED|nr:sigma 54-interacting transcriptional regulator [Pseudomonas triclosanedens]MCP8463998.1 sigma 54-interacting transcriptional regulator [Pseudomonas triclosanedens]MCP8469082.1 sigma 54-interacting transcriptional regulator [Pseudomonas triclosanedens]MCP8475804.1 sigma 54-interacting transcriptional regulator [Pseudomonas triclosanedens]WAI50491.1 sigma 54-interacting transcriptional regulator [Pseudomonas triclosanedens]